MEVVVVQPFALRNDDVHDRVRDLEAVSHRRRFESLLERHEARLRRVAYGMLGDSHRVDDVLQDAFVKAYRKLPARFENDKQEAAWLYRIVHRTCLNELRSRRRRPESRLSEDTPAPLSEDSLAVAAALAELSVDARAVVLLVDLIGLDYDTAASALRIPRGTVASRLNSARTKLRTILERDA
ncbi:MAG TPA: RNA polymerase sigma factor [Gaiellaceae bacterium]|nr:RNA polymerase sigma factor [Gaiellaceae bacterium]